MVLFSRTKVLLCERTSPSVHSSSTTTTVEIETLAKPSKRAQSAEEDIIGKTDSMCESLSVSASLWLNAISYVGTEWEANTCGAQHELTRVFSAAMSSLALFTVNIYLALLRWERRCPVAERVERRSANKPRLDSRSAAPLSSKYKYTQREL